MSDVAVTIHLPEDLFKMASELGVLSSEHIEMLLRADIQAQLMEMASDPQVQDELREIADEFAFTEQDGLPET